MYLRIMETTHETFQSCGNEAWNAALIALRKEVHSPLTISMRIKSRLQSQLAKAIACLQISTKGPPTPKTGSESGIGTARALAAFCAVSSSPALQKLLSQCGLPYLTVSKCIGA
jgi:hypothetical protein